MLVIKMEQVHKFLSFEGNNIKELMFSLWRDICLDMNRHCLNLITYFSIVFRKVYSESEVDRYLSLIFNL